MFGDKAVDLIKTLIRDSNDPMPPYSHELVNKVIEEMTQINEQIQQFMWV